MSLILPHPQPPPSHYPLSRSTTPRPTTPISAPPTPITPTHLLPTAMERARSSEAVYGEREGRRRDAKETTLVKAEWEHRESSKLAAGEDKLSETDKMDVDASGEAAPTEPSANSAAGGRLVAESSTSPSIAPIGTPVECIEPDVEVHLPTPPEEGQQFIWGMPKWGCEDGRKEIRTGVRTVNMAEVSDCIIICITPGADRIMAKLPELIERHALIDTPSSVLFPWLHGISDDGQKGRDMAAFFGYGPPFEPPAYRGLCLVYAPPHPLDQGPGRRPQPLRAETDRTTQPIRVETSYDIPPRERSETMSTSSESYHSTGTTEGTSPSVADWNSSPRSPGFGFEKLATEPEEGEEAGGSDADADADADVAMHPCDSKRVSPEAAAKGLDEIHHPLPCGGSHEDGDCNCNSSEEDEDDKPSCILFNALHVQDIVDLPPYNAKSIRTPRFKMARLPAQINLRNLNIQQIKYATVSDVVLYSKGGLGPGTLHVAEQIALAQNELYQTRMDEYYRHVQGNKGSGEGLDQPVKYGVWVVVEPFWRLEKTLPHLVNIDSKGITTTQSYMTDLFEREALESRAMTRGSEVVEGFWVGNDCDVPGGADDGAGAFATFDLCLRMPSTAALGAAHRKLLDLDKKRYARDEQPSSWIASPATIALRNLLSPSPNNANATTSVPAPDVPAKRMASPSPDERKRRSRSGGSVDTEYVSLECAGSCRTITGQVRNLSQMTDKVIELVYFLRKVIEGRDKTAINRRVLVHCQDGYTESSIIVLAYIMSSLSISLPEAFLHLQLVAKRSFFLYPSDKPLLRKIDSRLAADRRAKALKLIHSTPASPPASPTAPSPIAGRGSPRWKSWGLNFGSASGSKSEALRPQSQIVAVNTVEVAKEMLVDQEKGGSKAAAEAKLWFDDRRFDGFPSRILPFLYLGNLEHAGNAAMLKSLGITHVVSVGESLINTPSDHDPTYGAVGGNTLAAEARAGRISVLDLTDVRDDGNDPLRPVIARACTWIDHARSQGGAVLVHCRVGVSRSASIVIAYMMQYQGMGLMDAYMMCRARRLNVLIQPNLRFFHELFGWEVELARQDIELCRNRRDEAEDAGVRNPDALKLAEGDKRRIMYSWPSFCRDLHCLNRRFLCN